MDEKDPFVIDLCKHPKIFTVGGQNDL